MILNTILKKFKLNIPRKTLNSTKRHLSKIYPRNEDPWGLFLPKALKNLENIWPFYKHYFKVRLFGTENIEDTPYMIIANHSGQIAIDGMLISTAFASEISPPRILRPMVERFFTGIPFIGSWAQEGGAVLGDRQNCINLLNRGESVLIFPEGVRGVAKNTKDFYKLQSFTKGFFRIAHKTNTPILPISVIGAEEFYPYVYHPKMIAKILGLPALPLTFSLIPLPSPVDIYIGEPIEVNKEIDINNDSQVNAEVQRIHEVIEKMTKEGLKKRRNFWANKELEERQ